MTYTKNPKVVKPKLNLKNTLLGLGFSSAVVISVTQLIVPSEGIVLPPYLDPAGILTVCIGATNNNTIGFVIENKTYTEEECVILAAREAQEIEKRITPLIKTPINDYQKAAFIDFAYNKGIDAFKNSTILGLLNAGNIKASCEQLTRWVFAGNCKQGTKDCVEVSKGKWKLKLEGLVTRSELEMKYCLGEIKLQEGVQ
jgi:lysozyme